MPSARSRSKRKENPLSRFLSWYWGVLVALLVLGVLPGQEWVSSGFVYAPMFLVGGVAGLAWTFYGVQLGRISLMSKTGRTNVYRRRQEPILFFLVVAMFVAFNLGATVVGIWMFLSML